MSIGIVGLGTVGSAMYRCFAAAGCDVHGYDMDPARSRDSLAETLQQAVVLISVPVPENRNGLCDLSGIDGILNRAAYCQAAGSFVLRSTVPIGTTDQFITDYPTLKIGFSPELLRAASADFDFANPPMTVYGGDHAASFFKVMAAAYHPDAAPRQIVLRPGEAELLKLFLNSFAALKTVFASELAALAAVGGMNWENIVDAATIEGRLGKGYLEATGSDNLPGFDGACLPKDCRILMRQLGKNSLLTSVMAINDRLRASAKVEQRGKTPSVIQA